MCANGKVAVLVNELLKTYYTVDIDTKLDLDLAIRELKCSGELDQNDLEIVSLTKMQYSVPDISFKMGWSFATTYRKRSILTSKIAKRLGIIYQDFKIILQVQKKLGRQITEDERVFCWYVINHLGYKHDYRMSIFNFRIVNEKVVADED